ncbi:MAG: ABC transporter permease [Pseudolabrys sp.]|nr:ABC transporter permease [Pseudolabrys sp.]MCW5683104.1 ABC transporter permease [Pseudolabrys sp.]
MKAGWLRATIERVILFVALAAIWEIGVIAFKVKPYLLPRLSTVVESLWTFRTTLLVQSLVTANEIILGYIAAVIGGVILSLIIYAWPLARRTVYPLVVLFQGLPKIALAPLMIIWMGYGTSSKVFIAFLFAFFPVVISTLGGLSGTPQNLVEHFRSIRANTWTTFWRLQLPAALPSIMDGCKTAMPLAVIGAIVGEFVGSERGLGYLILDATAQAKTDMLFAALIAVSVLAGLLYWVVEILADRVWWRSL